MTIILDNFLVSLTTFKYTVHRIVLVCSQGDSTLPIFCSVQNVDFHRDSAVGCPNTMFTKLEQSSWIKIDVARCSSTQESFQGLRNACSDAALPYPTVARWVKASRKGRDAVQDNLCTGRRPHVENNTGQLLASLLDADRPMECE